MSEEIVHHVPLGQLPLLDEEGTMENRGRIERIKRGYTSTHILLDGQHGCLLGEGKKGKQKCEESLQVESSNNRHWKHSQVILRQYKVSYVVPRIGIPVRSLPSVCNLFV